MQAAHNIPVIVLNWNGIDDTEKCVHQLLNQSQQNLTIHLLDNGSDQSNIDRLHKLAAQHNSIKLRLFDENLGFTKAHNLAFEEILNSEEVPTYILLLNNDAFAHVDWAKEMILAADQHHADLVSCKMVNYFDQDVLDNVGHRFLNTGEIIPEGSGDDLSRYDALEENVGPCAGAALYRSQMLAEIGTFDPYFNTGYEDAELGVRAMVLGYKSIYTPKAIVHHKISQSVAKVRDFDYVHKTQVNIFYSYFKLMPWPVILINLPFLIFKYAVVLLLNLFTGRFFFFRVMWQAIRTCLGSERSVIKQARRAFYTNRKSISSIAIFRKMEFFLFFDIKRFYKHILKGEKTQFEKVHDV